VGDVPGDCHTWLPAAQTTVDRRTARLPLDAMR
jgi:hypothetical protein